MHRLGYTHTDLKPENIMLCSSELYEDDRNGKQFFSPVSKKIKLIDFGGATHES